VSPTRGGESPCDRIGDDEEGEMDFREFEARAHEIFDGIPPQFREGVDGLEVERTTVEHPSLPEIYTLGECRSEFYPSEFGGAGEVRSYVVLFYGSFLALSRVRDDWDWEEELWETVTHEVRHHLESLASDDALEEMDYADDQNFHRRQGEPFDPFFFRSAPPVAEATFRVDQDLFIEHGLSRRDFERARELIFSWNGAEWAIPRPERLGDVHFVRVDGLLEEPEELFLVLVRRRGPMEWVSDLLRGAEQEVAESDARAVRAAHSS
jgi:predicted Zn-dependent protease with MMP-like domain